MGKSKTEVDALRAEVEALRTEVALLRSQQAAHVCPTWPQGAWVWPAPGPQCSCGTSLRCMKHYPADWGNVWISAQNYCAGAAPVNTSYWLHTAGAAPVNTVQVNPLTTNACAGPQPLLTFNIPA